ncbi:DUF262 domain-containing protein [Enterococcus sp. AZ084]|uniref:DUF262 domain-containing protein n=1 Tax=Enterococcus sp. AZ084 TaxID=2774671 RepID=UPI003F23D551
MKITPETKTLAAIFQIGSSISYNIPIYQRNYSWREEQIETLFNDIKEEDIGYYVGNLLITVENDEKNIIDGQQRLTTLSLILLAIYEKLIEFTKDDDRSNQAYTDRLYEAKNDIKRQLLLKDSGLCRLTLLDRDNDIWMDLSQSILNNKEPGKWGKYSFYKRYNYIKERLMSDFKDGDEILKYYDKLINIELLQISVADLSDAYQVFASLNSKGLPLTPLDLIKNIFLSKDGNVNKWNELRSLFTVDDEFDDSKMTQFVLNNYDAFHNMKTTASITKGKLVKSYTDIFKNPSYIDELIDNAKVFIEITNSDYKKYDYSFSGLNQLDTTTAYPFLMYILKNKELHQLDQNDIDEIIRLLINFYVRRNVALVPKASNVRQHLFELKNKIYNENSKGTDLVKIVHQYVQELAPSDSQIENALSEGVYDVNKKTTRFILINLEREKTTYFHKGNPDSLDKFNENSNKRIWEIEHILPQSLTNEWRKMISPDDMAKGDSLKDDVVHLLGNLTLTPYNSGLGNSTFEEKLNYEDKGNLVGLNLNLHLNDSIDKQSKEWTKESILKRNSILTQEFIEKFCI